MRSNEPVPFSVLSAGAGPWDFGIGGTAAVGVLILDQHGQLESANRRAREILKADTPVAVSERLREIQRRLVELTGGTTQEVETSVDLPGVSVIVRHYPLDEGDVQRRVLLVWEAGSRAAAETILQQASRHRAISFLSRDWVHDLKGILHVIRINHAILARIIQQAGVTDAAVGSKCMETIPREVERMDRSLEVLLGARVSDQEATFDVGSLCERCVQFVAARASRQRVEVSLDLDGGKKDVMGIEYQIQSALLNLMVNALESMSESGHLVVSAEGGKTVKVRVSDDGTGIRAGLEDRMWQPRAVSGPRGTAIGLHVARSIVEAHGGHIACKPNVPAGTCFEIEFPPAEATGRS